MDTAPFKLSQVDLKALFKAFVAENYHVMGPTVRDGAVMLEELDAYEDLPRGYSGYVDKGKYSIQREAGDQSLFSYTTGPQSFKKFLHPPRRKLLEVSRSGKNIKMDRSNDCAPKMAFWGIRSCDLFAISTLDKVFVSNGFKYSYYKRARERVFILAVACTHPSKNCFCTSMNTGPKPETNFDLLLTEVCDLKEHFFILEVGSEKGYHMAKDLKFSEASESDIEKAAVVIEHSAAQMKIKMDPQKAATTIKENPEHKHWADVARRCLSCANCTMVCPTCFCTTVEDTTDITGQHSERWLRWDSCFNGSFSYIHGGYIRNSTKSRYRQWMSHKLAYWYDQFGTSGCVGCGRCITWCPVGIDITEELSALEKSKEKTIEALEYEDYS